MEVITFGEKHIMTCLRLVLSKFRTWTWLELAHPDLRIDLDVSAKTWDLTRTWAQRLETWLGLAKQWLGPTSAPHTLLGEFNKVSHTLLSSFLWIQVVSSQDQFHLYAASIISLNLSHFKMDLLFLTISASSASHGALVGDRS